MTIGSCFEAYNLFIVASMTTLEIATRQDITEAEALARVTIGRCLVNSLPLPYRAVSLADELTTARLCEKRLGGQQ